MAAVLVYLDKRILNIFVSKYTNMATNFFVVLIPRDSVKTLYSIAMRERLGLVYFSPGHRLCAHGNVFASFSIVWK